MSYASIDALQKTMADTVFAYASDRKKAAGRALGTLVEVVTYYALRTWGFSENIVIERRVPEFGNPAIEHNVEFSLHPVRRTHEVDVSEVLPPITAVKVKRLLPALSEEQVKQVEVLSSKNIKRNATVLVDRGSGPVVANIDGTGGRVIVCELAAQPFAIVECKRVGVEEGMRKVPRRLKRLSREHTLRGRCHHCRRCDCGAASSMASSKRRTAGFRQVRTMSSCGS